MRRGLSRQKQVEEERQGLRIKISRTPKPFASVLPWSEACVRPSLDLRAVSSCEVSTAYRFRAPGSLPAWEIGYKQPRDPVLLDHIRLFFWFRRIALQLTLPVSRCLLAAIPRSMAAISCLAVTRELQAARDPHRDFNTAPA
jgi:hypothetical protein